MVGCGHEKGIPCVFLWESRCERQQTARLRIGAPVADGRLWFPSRGEDVYERAWRDAPTQVQLAGPTFASRLAAKKSGHVTSVSLSQTHTHTHTRGPSGLGAIKTPHRQDRLSRDFLRTCAHVLPRSSNKTSLTIAPPLPPTTTITPPLARSFSSLSQTVVKKIKLFTSASTASRGG